jgi:hypothetical protein
MKSRYKTPAAAKTPGNGSRREPQRPLPPVGARRTRVLTGGRNAAAALAASSSRRQRIGTHYAGQLVAHHAWESV